MAEHVWIGGNCEFCGADDHDPGFDEPCDGRTEGDEIRYSTGPGGRSWSAGRFKDESIEDAPENHPQGEENER